MTKSSDKPSVKKRVTPPKVPPDPAKALNLKRKKPPQADTNACNKKANIRSVFDTESEMDDSDESPIVSEDPGDSLSNLMGGRAESGKVSLNVDVYDDVLVNLGSDPGNGDPSSISLAPDHAPIHSVMDTYGAYSKVPPTNPSPHAVIIIPEKPAQLNLSGPSISDIMPSNARKLFLTATDSDTRLANMNPILTKKSIDSLAGPVKDIQYLKTGNLFVECCSPTQMTQLLEMTKLTINLKDVPVKFSLALADQSVRGKIYAPNLKDCSLDDILTELEPYKAVKVEKLLKDPARTHVPLYLITFLGSTCPPSIKVACCQYKVDRFIPDVIKCTNCCRFGHTKKYCTSQPTCGKCGKKGHLSNDCTDDLLSCPHCKGAHSAFSNECKKTSDERQINNLKHSNNLTYFEARNQFLTNSQAPNRLQHSDPLLLRTPHQDLPEIDNRNIFPPLQMNRMGNNTPPLINSVRSSHSQDSTRFTPNQVNSDSPYSINNSPFTLNLKKNRTYLNTTSDSLPTLSQIAQSQTVSSKITSSIIASPELNEIPLLPNRKTSHKPEISLTTITVILKQVVRYIFPTLIKLTLCDSLTSKIETLKEFGSSVDMDDTIDSILEDLNPSLSSTQ